MANKPFEDFVIYDNQGNEKKIYMAKKCIVPKTKYKIKKRQI